MMHIINKITEDIKNQQITITGWILSFIGIIFVRFILESLSSPTSTGIMPSDPYSLVHIGLYFITVTIGTILIFGFFIKNYKDSAKFVLFGLPLLWLAPIIDILISKGDGFKMLYIFDSGKNLIFDFFTFFGPDLTSGATFGIRFIIALSLFGLGYLTYTNTKEKKIKNTLLCIFFIYLFVFILATLPGIIFTLSNINSTPSTNAEIVNFFEKIIINSNIYHNTLKEGFLSVSTSRFLELEFDKLFSQILFLVSFLISLLFFWKLEPRKFWSTIKNARSERINFYTISLFCGIGFAYLNGLGNTFVLLDLLSIICLVISWGSLWMQAVHLNDINDIEIDKISNTSRPLIKNEMSISEMRDVGNQWLIVALVGAWSVGFYQFFFALVYVACSYIYSAPPLRLRRFPLISSFLIGVACLSTILAGFFLISVEKEVYNFPIFLSIGIVIMVTLAINFKDIKDENGDKTNGIMTIPSLFPRHGIKIVGILFALSILLVPIFLSFYLLYIISVPASIIGYKLITRKPYVEKYIFILRFFFLGGVAIAYLLLFWLADVYNLV